MTCPCGNEATFTCGWKLRKPFMIWAKDLKEGDKMQIPHKIAHSQVIRIAPGFTSGWLHVTLEVMPKSYMFRGQMVYEKFYALTPGDPVMVIRPGHCEAPCCVNCAREVGEHTYHCRAHWDAGERQDAIDQRVEVEA